MDLTSRTCSVNGVELQVIESGPNDGPLVLLLHGFPDFWWGWRHQIEPLTRLGFHVVVPDQRGYNLSSKPEGISAYNLDTLATDVLALSDFYKVQTFSLVGHDWGGIIAWWVAAHHPERVERLAIFNAPHPDVFARYVRLHPTQALKSLYAAFFQLPRFPELVLRLRRFALLRGVLSRRSRPGTFTAVDLDRYVEAWQPPGALTAMLNYYRALGRRPLRWLTPIQVPTLVVWGLKDPFLEVGLARASLDLCDHPHSLFLHTAGHWVHLEEVETVNEALSRFLVSN